MSEQKIVYKYRISLDIDINQDPLNAANSGQAMEAVMSAINSVTYGLNENLQNVETRISVPENGVVLLSE